LVRFGHKREKVAGGWRRLHNEEFHSDKVKEDEMFRAFSTHGRDEKLYTIFIRKPKGKRLFRGHRHRWEGNIRMDFREIGQEDVDWMHLAQDRG
jgi:hypothetical protein